MTSREYKRQFLEFIQAAYPDGLPAGAEASIRLGINTSDGSIRRYDFKFDIQDYETFLKTNKPPVGLTVADIKWLREQGISVAG